MRDGRLAIAGRDAEQLAREHGTPVFVHDLVAAREQATTLRDAMADAGLRYRIRLALKAQRDPDFLRFLREETPFVGVDVCSPGETEWALAHGWAPEEISYTGTNVSEADLDRLLPTGVHLNARSALPARPSRPACPRLDDRDPREPGYRCVVSRRGRDPLRGSAPTKFGVLPERLADAVEIANGTTSRSIPCTTTRATST